MQKTSYSTFIRILAKSLAWILGSIIALLLLLAILIQIPSFQNYAKVKALIYLEGKLKTKVTVGNLNIRFPNHILLEHVYFEDQHKDTLLYGARISVDIALFKLLKDTVAVKAVELENIQINIHRNLPDTVFNFDYIVKAFSSDTSKETKPKDSISPLQFKLGKILLKNIHFRYKDDLSGIDSRFIIGNLKTKISHFNPNFGSYELSSIEITGLIARMKMYQAAQQENTQSTESTRLEDSVSKFPSFSMGTLSLQQADIMYDEVGKMGVTVDLKELKLKPGSLDFSKMSIPIEMFVLRGAQVAVRLDKKNQQLAKSTTTKKVIAAPSWKLSVAKAVFDSNHFSFHDYNEKSFKKGIDYHHIVLQNFGVQLDSLLLSPNIYSGKISKLHFSEKSGLNVKEISTIFSYTDKEAKLEKLLLQTDRSIIQDKVIVGYPSISSIAKKPGDISLEVELKNSSLAVSELLLLAPMLDSIFAKHRTSIIKVNGSMKGFVKNLTIPNFEMSGLGKSSISIKGNIIGLPKLEQTFANISLKYLNTTRADIESFTPAHTIPDNIKIPENIRVTGMFNGSIKDFKTNLVLNSSDGSARLIASLNNKGEFYDASIQVDTLNLGSILKQDSLLGKVSLTATAKGSGFDYKTMKTNLTAKVEKANIKGYQYKNVLADIKLNNGNAKIEASIKDTNINIQLDGTASLKNKYPAVKMNMLIDTINFHALHLMQDSLSFHGNLMADFSNTNPDSLDGSLFMTAINFSLGNKSYITDTISLIASHTDSNQSIKVHSELAKINMHGKYRLTELATAVQHHVKKYYQLKGFKDTLFTPQQWEADMVFGVSPLLLKVVPDLIGTEPISSKITFDSEKEALEFSLNAPLLKYAGQSFKHINAHVLTDKEAIKYQVSLERLGTKKEVLNRINLEGNVSKNSIFGNLTIKNKSFEKIYQMAATGAQTGSGFKFQLQPDSLLLNQQTWKVNPDNFIRFDSSGVFANHFDITNKDQSLSINSLGTSNHDPLSMVFKQFNIKTLTNIVKSDSINIEGVINGEAVIKNVTSKPVFTSNIVVTGLAYQQTGLGTLELKVDNQLEDRYTANITLKGIGTQLSLNGFYRSSESLVDLKLLVDSLNLATIKPFSLNQIKEAGGNMTADVRIVGTMDKPKINGFMSFNKAFITSTMLGQKFSMADERIDVSDNNIQFKQFTLTDSIGNKAILDGSIATNNFQNLGFNLNLIAENFNLISSTKADNKLFYGKLNLDADINITGSVSEPVVVAKLKANKNTNLTVVLPSSDPELQKREGVVNFIDKRLVSEIAQQINLKDSLVKQTTLKGINFSSVIETDTGAVFTMVIDSRTGDALTIQGKSSLSGGLDESGKLSLTGMYEVERGSYLVSFNFLKRKFELVKGSTMNWTGDPLSASLNITALYETKASTIDLVAAELGGLTTAELNKYKQRIPVQVFLKMRGELLKPQISFDIIIPEPEASKWQVVDDKLKQIRTDESQMNKQVFAILFLGRFVGEDITQNSTGSTTTETMVRQSVGSILSDQLTKAANGIIKGVDLSIGFESQDDYSTGAQQTRTDMKVGLSKSLNNDRIKVNVGTNVALEGVSTSQNSSKISGDVSVDYLITKDGRYMLRTYSKNNYEGVIEGDIIESGITFIFTVEYEKIGDIFRKKSKLIPENKSKKK